MRTVEVVHQIIALEVVGLLEALVGLLELLVGDLEVVVGLGKQSPRCLELPVETNLREDDERHDEGGEEEADDDQTGFALLVFDSVVMRFVDDGEDGRHLEGAEIGLAEIGVLEGAEQVVVGPVDVAHLVELGGEFGQGHVFGDATADIGDGREYQIAELQRGIVGLAVSLGEPRIGKGALFGVAAGHQVEERVDAALVIAVIVVEIGADDGAIDLLGFVHQDGIVPDACLLEHPGPDARHDALGVVGPPAHDGMLHVVVAQQGGRVAFVEPDGLELLEGGVIESPHAQDTCLVHLTTYLQLAVGGVFGQVTQLVEGAERTIGLKVEKEVVEFGQRLDTLVALALGRKMQEAVGSLEPQLLIVSLVGNRFVETFQ